MGRKAGAEFREKTVKEAEESPGTGGPTGGDSKSSGSLSGDRLIPDTVKEKAFPGKVNATTGEVENTGSEKTAWGS